MGVAGLVARAAPADDAPNTLDRPPSRTFLTPAKDFVNVSRGDPLPYTLKPDALIKARLTPETWQLEVVAEDKAEIDKPLRIANGTALDFLRPPQARREAWHSILESDAVFQHRPPARSRIMGGGSAPGNSQTVRPAQELASVVLLGISQRRPRADVPIVFGHESSAGHAARRIAAVYRLQAQRRAHPARARRPGADGGPLGTRIQVGQVAPEDRPHESVRQQ